MRTQPLWCTCAFAVACLFLAASLVLFALAAMFQKDTMVYSFFTFVIAIGLARTPQVILRKRRDQTTATPE